LKNDIFKVYLNPHIHLWLLEQDFQSISSEFKGHIIESYWLHWALTINDHNKIFYYLKDKENKEVDFVSLNPIGQPTFKTLHEIKYSANLQKYDFHLLKDLESINKVIWTINDGVHDGIKTKSVLKLKNPYK
jgi:hypothetical protein